MTVTKLTEGQKRFAEEHHEVLENFLKYRSLPFDEYYDIVVFRFLRAVQQYDEREDLKKYSFETIAKNHMRSALGNYFRKKKGEKNKFVFLSLDYPLTESGLTLGDTIADDSVDICEEVCRKLSRTSKKCRLSYRYPICFATGQNAMQEVI